ncbi:MAG: transcriptional repressor NrdR [Deltaproteobacteria bacterium]|nr:transcriptional repressor NrdR [Deltaproteobacteria bacterium]
MKCPFCSYQDSKVIDSRLSKEGDIIRRRRECDECQKRFTTYERVEETLPLIVKKDGRREAFDRVKMIGGVTKACEKRPVSIDLINKMADRIESELMERSEKEVPASVIGEKIMEELKKLDDVAYVRFASVYRSFKDIGEFVNLIKDHEKQENES